MSWRVDEAESREGRPVWSILRGGSSHVAISAISWLCHGTQQARMWKEGGDRVGRRELIAWLRVIF